MTDRCENTGVPVQFCTCVKCAKPKSKYNAVRTVVDGVAFDSKAEAERYSQLKLLERAGEIRDLAIHRRWPLMAICEETDVTAVVAHYESDFDYFTKDGRRVVEDTKGVKTETYRLKKKIFDMQYAPLKITEIQSRKSRRGLRRRAA